MYFWHFFSSQALFEYIFHHENDVKTVSFEFMPFSLVIFSDIGDFDSEMFYFLPYKQMELLKIGALLILSNPLSVTTGKFIINIELVRTVPGPREYVDIH